LAALAPKKAGFDLARELQERIEKLEKETSYCIAENIRQRLKSSKDISENAIGAEGLSDDDD
jgi:hypothetical protein